MSKVVTGASAIVTINGQKSYSSSQWNLDVGNDSPYYRVGAVFNAVRSSPKYIRNKIDNTRLRSRFYKYGYQGKEIAEFLSEFLNSMEVSKVMILLSRIGGI